jgi:hypothetical protein
MGQNSRAYGPLGVNLALECVDIGLVLDMRREPPHRKIAETALFAGDRERLTNHFAGRIPSRRHAFCHFLAHPRFGDLADDTMYALTKGKPIR